jgi:hypothetical protein
MRFYKHISTSYKNRMSNEIPSDFSLAGGHYAAADFQDAEDSRPTAAYMEAFGGNESINGIVSQALSRHVSESVPASSSPLLGSFSTNTNNWRKKLREMMIKQNEQVLDFLMKPSSEHHILGPVETALRRYSVRQDIDPNAIRSVSEVCADMPNGDAIQEEIKKRLLEKGKSSLSELRLQVNSLIELYKETGEKVLECENQLKMRLDKIDKLHKRVSVIMELQKNESTATLLGAMEEYIATSFRDMGIETYYKDMIYLYQKHMALREAIQLFKTGTTLPSEPTCPICLEDHVSYAIIPCGHTFCTSCSRRMAMECGICRGKIRDRLKLFMT